MKSKPIPLYGYRGYRNNTLGLYFCRRQFRQLWDVPPHVWSLWVTLSSTPVHHSHRVTLEKSQFGTNRIRIGNKATYSGVSIVRRFLHRCRQSHCYVYVEYEA